MKTRERQKICVRWTLLLWLAYSIGYVLNRKMKERRIGVCGVRVENFDFL